ncbi:GntR family transcriptional regulator [Reinekea sp.]|jgi:DNA-binding transcriptional regulator YhcF (GntR family)|uniref:GntR family transcriptional regulator n=1 Tax=Reinekea sp. TaxID=1970455 RepID=UPI002A7F034C|nr:GntR family transcriptional regulator [Reinekea sp.]
MMQFDSASTIYLQVADFMSEKILTDQWPEQQRIPSIREVAALVQVNPNTVMRSFAHLQENDIIFNKRGVGYFVNEHGKQHIRKIKKVGFIHAKLPRIFHEAALLAVSPSELSELYSQFLGSQK